MLVNNYLPSYNIICTNLLAISQLRLIFCSVIRYSKSFRSTVRLTGNYNRSFIYLKMENKLKGCNFWTVL